MPLFFNKYGLVSLSLGQQIDSLQMKVIPFPLSNIKDLFSVSPDENDWFVIDSDTGYLSDSDIEIGPVFLLCSKERTIRKIKIYGKEKGDILFQTFSREFGNPLTGGNIYNTHYVWNLLKDTTAYLFKTNNDFYPSMGYNFELTFSYVNDAENFGKYIVRPKFK